MGHHTLATSPSGQKELTLNPIGGKTERLVYSALVVGMWVGGLFLLPGTMGFALLGVALVCSFVLFRITNRREKWEFAAGAATRVLTGFGSSRETFVPKRVVVLAEEDNDDHRKVYRLQLEHAAGTVQIGTSTFDRDERALMLARAFGDAAGVAVQQPPAT
ncbi:MAG: hypothetical protein JNK82_23160 [Myxococcaceae bacterium]|nr:hypothetical protein [Myxococcaceae bacterium]